MMILQQTRGALSSGDQLALDLPFAETKSLAARIGPSPTFTRGSGATYVGSDGLIHGVDTSTTSNTIGTGSKTFTLTATAGQDQFWRTGDAVDASNGSNSMVGTVTSYNASTQVLVCNMTSVTGSGTFTSWRIGYRGPRFDHNPANPTICRGLLIEEGRTNLFQRSEEFDNSYWTKLRASVDDNATTSPAGDSAADKLIEDNSSGTHMAFRLLNTGALVAHTFSIYAKADGRNFLYLSCSDGFPANATAFFNLSNGTLGTVGANATASISPLSNGWYRCSITATPTSTSGNGFYIQTASANGTISYQGDGTSGIFIWGAQSEAGSFATSYIPTTTSALARSADVCSITGAAFSGFYNATEGTSFVSAIRYTNFANPRSLAITNGTSGNRAEINRGTFVDQIDYYAGGSFLHSLNLSAATVGVNYRIAHAIAANNFAASMNGASPVVNNSGVMVTADRMTIGASFQGSAAFHNGTISAIRYYKKRLSNQKLQALTA